VCDEEDCNGRTERTGILSIAVKWSNAPIDRGGRASALTLDVVRMNFAEGLAKVRAASFLAALPVRNDSCAGARIGVATTRGEFAGDTEISRGQYTRAADAALWMTRQ